LLNVALHWSKAKLANASTLAILHELALEKQKQMGVTPCLKK